MKGFHFSILLTFASLCCLTPHLEAQRKLGKPPYPPHADSIRKEGVPRGTLTHGTFTDSKAFPGTVRDYWVYVPAQYDATKPACLMVINDGRKVWRDDSFIRAPIVFDNLIHQGEMPVTVGVFINPGKVLASDPNKSSDRDNRAFEYDTVNDRYPNFLVDEFLPVVLKGLNVSAKPKDRGIAGGSSGGIAAFNVAWQRPDSFRRVFSWVGTFVGIRGGNEFPVLVRKTAPKPLRVFLEDGSNDINASTGSWWVANQDMLAALKFSGYEVDYSWSDGVHGPYSAATIMPDVMRWLWKTWPESPTTHFDQSKSAAVTKQLIEGETWELIADGFADAQGLAIAPDGTLFISDPTRSKIYSLNPEENSTAEIWLENSGRTSGLAFDNEGRLYACQKDARQVVRWDLESKAVEVLAKGIEPESIIVSHDGTVYFTEPKSRSVWCIPSDKGPPFVAADNYSGVNGLALSPDQSLLYVSDSSGRYVWSARRADNGSLTHNQPYFHLHLPPASVDSRSLAGGMGVARNGTLLVATAMGVQSCEPKFSTTDLIVPLPHGVQAPTDLCFSEGGSSIIAVCGNTLYRLKTQFQGVEPHSRPILPIEQKTDR